MEKKTLQAIKRATRENYAKIALNESSACCAPGCCSSATPIDSAADVGYDVKELGSIPEASILGVGCGAPIKSADLQKGETVIDLGSGAGIDVFLAAKRVGRSGKVIGIDMTEEMLQRARRNARNGGYVNVEFRKGDIEKKIPVETDFADAVVSNCVINLTTDKVRAFREIRRILKRGGRMVISDLVADGKTNKIDPARWFSCIDGAMLKVDYLESIRKAGFKDLVVLEERQYLDGELTDSKKITSILVRAVKP